MFSAKGACISLITRDLDGMKHSFVSREFGNLILCQFNYFRQHTGPVLAQTDLPCDLLSLKINVKSIAICHIPLI